MANFKQKLRKDLGQIETDVRDRGYRPQSARNLHNMSITLKTSQILDSTPYKTKDETLSSGLSSGLFSTISPSHFKEKLALPKSTRSMKSITSKHRPSVDIETLFDKKQSMNRLEIDRDEISTHLKELKEEFGHTNSISRADQLRDRKIEHLEKRIIQISENKSAMRDKLKRHMEIYSDFLDWISNKHIHSVTSDQIIHKIRSLANSSPIPSEQVKVAKLSRSKSFERKRFKSPYNSLPFQIPTQTRRSVVSLIMSQSKSPTAEDEWVRELWALLSRFKNLLEYKPK